MQHLPVGLYTTIHDPHSVPQVHLEAATSPLADLRPPAPGRVGHLLAAGVRCGTAGSAATKSASARCPRGLASGSARLPVEPTTSPKTDFGSPPCHEPCWPRHVEKLSLFFNRVHLAADSCTPPSRELRERRARVSSTHSLVHSGWYDSVSCYTGACAITVGAHLGRYSRVLLV